MPPKNNKNSTPIPPPPELVYLSIFPTWRARAAGDVSLAYVAEAVTGRRHPDYYPIITELRQTDKATAPGRYNELKALLPCVSVSALVPPGATSSAYRPEHTGMLCIDVDGADNPHITDWAALRSALGRLPFVYLSALSAGGRGCFVIVAVDPRGNHADNFTALLDYFARLGLTGDRACGNQNRLRAMTYDPDAVIKAPTTYFKAVFSRVGPSVNKSPAPRLEAPKNSLRTSFDGDNFVRVRAAARIWVRRGLDVGYCDWARAAAALQTVPDGATLFHDISAVGAKYKNAADVARQFAASASMSKVGPGSFIELCRRLGITDDEIDDEARVIRGCTVARRPGHIDAATDFADIIAPEVPKTNV